MAKVYQDPRSPLIAGRKAWFLDYFDLQGRRRRERTPATTKAEAEALLRAKLSEMAKARIAGVQSPFVGPEGPTPFVFVNPETGGPYRPDSVYHAFMKAAKTAGIDDVVFHTLRHTYVSRLVQAGVPDRKIMKIVGHSSSHMVSRYAHLAPDNLQGVADVLVEAKKPARRAIQQGSR